MIYFDHAATTQMSEKAVETFVYATKRYYANSSSLHDLGTEVDFMLDKCRSQLAKMIQGDEAGVYFTSGGTESNQLAIETLVEGYRQFGNHLITTEIEHASVYNLFKHLEDEGFEVTYLPVNKYGEVDLKRLEKAIKETTILASIHHANSEIGTVQNIKEIGRILHKHKVLFHTDTVQTFGKLAIDVANSYIDSLSISSHKIGGPKGVGASYIKPGLKWKQRIENSHEGGLRGGTVNFPGIVSFISAAQESVENMEENQLHFNSLAMQLMKGLQPSEGLFELEGSRSSKLSHIVGLSLHNIEGQYVMLECNRFGLAISTGSACQLGYQSPSRVMLARGKSPAEAKQFIRISFGVSNTKAEVAKLTDTLNEIMRNMSLYR